MEDHTIHVLIVDESSENAEMVTNLLRSAGLAVRAKRIEDDEDMQEALDEHRWDMVISAPKLTYFSATQALEMIKQSEKDIPVVVLTNGGAEMTAADALRAGARDMVTEDQPEHRQLVVQREFDALTERRAHKQCKKAFRETEKRCRGLIDSSRDAITYVHEGMHIYANAVYLEMFGYADEEEIEGMPIMDMVAPDDHARFKDFLRSFNKANEELSGELEVRGIRTDGAEFDALMEFSPASIEGEHCTQIIIRQQSNKELEKQIKVLSKQDLLTGLYNRQYFMEKLEAAVADAGAGTDAEPAILVYMELDNFDAIKQDVGIAASDLVLGDVAKLLQSKFGDPHIPARFEADIFTILCNDMDAVQAQALAEELKREISDHISEVGDKSVTTTCSIGISQVTEQAGEAQIVLSRASHACRVANSEGGNAIHVHSLAEDKEAGIESSEESLARISNAIENDLFRLFYQPIVSLQGSTDANYEVLVRMQGEDGELVMPDQFIPAAEKTGQMTLVDRWIIAHAIDVLGEQQAAGNQMSFFIKLSSSAIADKTLLPWISELLKTARVSGDSLVFQMPESHAMTHLALAKALVNGLKELRCKTVLTHFGSGLNPFNVLKHLDVDYLKIDGVLIRELSNAPQNQADVKSLNDRAHSMGKLTIAESVEDANSLAVLWQCGINHIQGNFLQEPSETLDYDFSAT